MGKTRKERLKKEDPLYFAALHLFFFLEKLGMSVNHISTYAVGSMADKMYRIQTACKALDFSHRQKKKL